MNNIIFQTIRAVVILGVALFAFVGEVFAAPTMLPVSVVEITNTSAVLKGYAQSYDTDSVVWFEWSEASSASAPTVFAMRGFYGDGFFSSRLDGLTPGVTYSFRAVAKGGGATVYSTVTSFKTSGGVSTTATTAVPQGPLGLGTISSRADTSQVSSTRNTSSNTQSVASTNKSTNTKTVVAKNTNTTSENYSNINSATNATNPNSNTASVVGAGSSLFPSTLIGWIALLVSILLIILISHMIYEQGEKRKRKPLQRERENGVAMA